MLRRRPVWLASVALLAGAGCTSTVAGTPTAAQHARPSSRPTAQPSGSPPASSVTPPRQPANMCTVLPSATVNEIFGEKMTTQKPSPTSCTWLNPEGQILIVSVWPNLDLYQNVDGNQRRFSYEGHPAQLGMNEFGIALGSSGAADGMIEAIGLETKPSFLKAGERMAERLLAFYT